MTDINEKETLDYFVSGIKAARSAAKELAILNTGGAWSQIVIGLDQILENAKKLYEGKAQTRLQTLALANQIMGDEPVDASPQKIIH